MLKFASFAFYNLILALNLMLNPLLYKSLYNHLFLFKYNFTKSIH